MKRNKDTKKCSCADSCACYAAEKLSVSCGCDMEAKQFEYGMDSKCCHTEHAHGVEGVAKVPTGNVIYTCPMHPDVVRDRPGKCPGCGMDLIPKAIGPANDEDVASAHGGHGSSLSGPVMAGKMEADMRRRFWISLMLSVPIIILSPVGMKFIELDIIPTAFVDPLLLILTTPVVFWSGSIFITGTYYSLKAKKLNMAVLIATGVLAAYLFSALLTFIQPGSETFYEAAALLVTFVLFGHWMEMRSRRGTSDALRALFDLVPPKANVVRDGKELSIPSAEIVHGDIIILRPGDKVPVDGTITEGETSIDESLITGESIPVVKTVGGKVIGGSVNQTGTVRFGATQIGSETVLAGIIKMVETAQNSKAPGQRIADRAAAYLVVVAIGSGLIAFIGWYFGAGAGLITSLTFAVSAVVIACPDALGLATPTAVAVGTGIGAKHNILIKDAATLENASRVNAVVLDKTGTLTEGRPMVTDVIAFNGFTEGQILNYEASVEVGSNHPLARAIMEEAEKRGAVPLESISKFESVAGRGLRAIIGDKKILAGKEKFLTEDNVAIGSAREVLDRLAGEGKTLSLIAIDGKLAGVIAAADTIKKTASSAVSSLKQLGIEVAMITGDHPGVAEAVGKTLGIERIFAEVLPEDKEKYIRKLQDEGKFVAMVGDGINDAPALARADIGIAIGAGTDVAIETGNIVLMKSDPYDIVSAIRLSRATVTKMKQNLFWAAAYNLLAIPVAAGAFYNSMGLYLRPEMAALLMSISSIVVALNAVSLKKVESKLRT